MCHNKRAKLINFLLFAVVPLHRRALLVMLLHLGKLASSPLFCSKKAPKCVKMSGQNLWLFVVCCHSFVPRLVGALVVIAFTPWGLASSTFFLLQKRNRQLGGKMHNKKLGRRDSCQNDNWVSRLLAFQPCYWNSKLGCCDSWQCDNWILTR